MKRRKKYRYQKSISAAAKANGRRVNLSPCTYIIEAEGTGAIKIGKTTYLKDRVKALQAACPHRLTVLRIIGGMEHEGALHRELKKHRIRGEWYEKTPEVVEIINLYRRGDVNFQPIDRAPVEIAKPEG